jgi:hypothetical protein
LTFAAQFVLPTDYTWQAGDGSEWSIAKLVEIELSTAWML